MTEKHTLNITDITFDAAQYLPVEFGKCHNLHGHTYHIKNLEIQTEGIVDFSKIKKLVDEFDHCILTTTEDKTKFQKILEFMVKENIDIFNLKFVAIPKPMVVVEYLGQYIKEQLKSIVGVIDATFELYETPTQGVKIP